MRLASTPVASTDEKFRYFNSSPEVIRLTVLMYIRYPLSLRSVEDLLFERASTFATRRCGSGGIGSVRCLHSEIRKRRIDHQLVLALAPGLRADGAPPRLSPTVGSMATDDEDDIDLVKRNQCA